MRIMERGTTTAMVIAFTDGSTGDVVSGELVSGGSSVVELKMASGEQVEL